MNCMSCNKEMRLGFMFGNQSIRVMAVKTMTKRFKTEIGSDLRKVPFWKKIFPSTVSFIQCHICEDCGLVVINYKDNLSLEDAQNIAIKKISSNIPQTNVTESDTSIINQKPRGHGSPIRGFMIKGIAGIAGRAIRRSHPTIRR